ncbi:hypothetical protein HU675_0045425 [Bradyrhizobium septentrionale]|uniref:hypothetical protein n=1 Tax=Bradyrhizobium septentrionale TaxID=1404411 RepID=UPI001596FE35|nr:hypothetical protein [Bradyrhizobium septentrionale]UGY25034.1 hypothetical protein HU675_0045425 [Bradyrhizobium septentrionale]
MRWVLTPVGLEPFDAAAREFHRSQTSGEPITTQVIEIEALHDRDMIEHRRIMATINDLAKALRTTPERVRAELLVATGNFQLLGELLGREVVAINSMSRRNMKDHELHEFWDEAKEAINTKLLARIADPAEKDRLAAMLSLQPA